MIIECIRIKDLIDFVESERFKNLEVIPISRHRAISHAKNPIAHTDDVALLLIYENEKLLAYLGLLPELISNGKKENRAAWFSCLWVSPEARGKGLAKQLITKAYKEWEGKILITDFAHASKMLFDKTQLFTDLRIKNGTRAYLHLNLTSLMIKKNPKWRTMKFVFQTVDFFFNLLNNFRLLFYKKNRYSDISMQETNDIDEETWSFIQPLKKNELFQRNRNALNWILKYPWLSSNQAALVDASRYYFSCYEKKANFTNLKIYQKEKLIGFLILSQRADTLKVPYIYFDEKNTDIIKNMLVEFMLKNKISIITLYNLPLVNYMKKKSKPFFILRDFKRHYLISKTIASQDDGNKFDFQDGDGDCAFT